MLRSAGVTTVGDLRGIGPVMTYRRLHAVGERPSLVLLWAMVAGLRGEHWTSIPQDEKQALRAELDTAEPSEQEARR